MCVNRSGARVLGAAGQEFAGTATPFQLAHNVAAEPVGLFDDAGEQVTRWQPRNGHRWVTLIPAGRFLTR